MEHYIVKLSCLRRSMNERKQIGIEMSLKSRRGSHNLKFDGQTIPDAGAGTANALSPIFRLARRTIRLLLLDDLSDDRDEDRLPIKSLIILLIL